MVKVKGKKAGVVYEGGEEIYDTYLAHLENLGKNLVDEPGDVVATVCYKGKWYKKSQTFYTIMAHLRVYLKSPNIFINHRFSHLQG